MSSKTSVSSTDKSIVIFYDNDVHGGIDGYAKIAGLRDAVAQSDTAWAAAVSCGDYLSGGVACTLKEGLYIANIISSTGYDVLTLGNHEFDFGVPRLMELVPQMHAPVVCANLYDQQGKNPLLPAYVVKQYGNKRVAFVGVTTPESMTLEGYAFYDLDGRQLYDLRTADFYQLVQRVVDQARREGADYVVVLSHLGEEDGETGITSHRLVAATRGIDVVLDGHTHHVFVRQEVQNLDGQPVPVTQTGTQFANVGKLVITRDGHFVTSLLANAAIPYSSKKVTATIDSVKTDMHEITSRQLCQIDYELTINDDKGDRLCRLAETNLGDLVADAYVDFLKSDIGLMNGGGLRNSIPAGSVGYGDVVNALPFINRLCEIDVTGRQLLDMLTKCTSSLPLEDGFFPHVSGMTYTVHTKRHVVTDVMVRNSQTQAFEPLALDRHYRVATIDYYSRGGFYDMLKSCPFLVSTKVLNRDCVADYMLKLTPADIQRYRTSQQRVTIVND
ncbi:MAG: bifunctional metallophosphatase/5'-nucleotidase [Prevotella sp.]|nr:bifunctional metallophosphatase/5'-nucleotidase [Prevotella sp.]